VDDGSTALEKRHMRKGDYQGSAGTPGRKLITQTTSPEKSHDPKWTVGKDGSQSKRELAEKKKGGSKFQS